MRRQALSVGFVHGTRAFATFEGIVHQELVGAIAFDNKARSKAPNSGIACMVNILRLGSRSLKRSGLVRVKIWIQEDPLL